MAILPSPLGIVIPTLNEEAHLPLLLEDLQALRVPARIVVSDGGSLDGTLREARARDARIVDAPPGRARQLNAGARVLSTDWLLFLHADTRIPEQTLRATEAWISGADPQDFGTFRFSLEGRHWFWRFIELGQRLREGVAGLAYGDQGLLLSRVLFDAVGGFPDLPVMEDVEVLRRLRRSGRWTRIPAPVISSPRRYREGGRWTVWIRNTLLISLFLAGVSPRHLARLHPPRRQDGVTRPEKGRLGPGGPPSRRVESETEMINLPSRLAVPQDAPGGAPPRRSGKDPRLLLVFAKDPVPGRVKTRLGAVVGDRRAARIYRDMGRGIVDGLRRGAFRVRVCFDPPGSEAAVKTWMDPADLEFQPQVSGDLGIRLEAAVRRGLEEAEAVLVIGTDAPGVDRPLVEKAFAELSHSDLVLGPTEDGGYYLLGLKEPTPSLFQDIPWSTAGVLNATRARAEALGLVIHELPPLRDLDTVEDLKVLGVRGPNEA